MSWDLRDRLAAQAFGKRFNDDEEKKAPMTMEVLLPSWTVPQLPISTLAECPGQEYEKKLKEKELKRKGCDPEMRKIAEEKM